MDGAAFSHVFYVSRIYDPSLHTEKPFVPLNFLSAFFFFESIFRGAVKIQNFVLAVGRSLANMCDLFWASYGPFVSYIVYKLRENDFVQGLPR